MVADLKVLETAIACTEYGCKDIEARDFHLRPDDLLDETTLEIEELRRRKDVIDSLPGAIASGNSES